VAGCLVSGMDRIWQWAWDRHGARYSWAMCAITYLASAPIYLLPSVLVVAFEGSRHYLEAIALTILTLPVVVVVAALPGMGQSRLIERWAAGDGVDSASLLAASYAWSRGVVARVVASSVVWAAMLLASVGALAGAPGLRVVQYAILGAVFGAVPLIGVHSIVESAMRPVRVAIAGDSGIGDSLPSSRPSFAT
jgi:adenylate cyclase